MSDWFSLQHIVSRKQFAICATLALVLAAGLADVRAEVIQYWTDVTYSGPVNLPRFDPTNGQLSEVALSFVAEETGNVSVWNWTPDMVGFSFSLYGTASAYVSGTSLFANGSMSGQGGGTIPPNSFASFFAVADGSASTNTSLADDLSFFTGTDPVEVSWVKGPLNCFSSPLSGDYSGNWAWGRIELSYIYEVPEPTTVTLLVGGLASLGLLSKRKPANPTDNLS